MKVSELLEQQIKLSEEYSMSNFGQTIGPGYSDFVKDATDSQKAAASILVGAIMQQLMAKQVGEKLKKQQEETGKTTPATRVIKENIPMFDMYYAFLYWGIEIGKKLGKEEKEVSALEKMVGL